mmetsp:Transcript_29515/g.48706  ORF Transcript_29515/g.48706 Transcript_29515/m.48706 type:complete len:158 (-) Transcript_29515:117-590(-)
MDAHNDNATVRRVPHVKEKASDHTHRITEEIEHVKKQIKLQRLRLEELERGQESLLERLKNVDRSPLEKRAMEVAQHLNETKTNCKFIMKEVVKMDESTQRRRTEMTILWMKIQDQVHRGAEAQSTLRRGSMNHKPDRTTEEKQAQVHQRWQRRLSL